MHLFKLTYGGGTQYHYDHATCSCGKWKHEIYPLEHGDGGRSGVNKLERAETRTAIKKEFREHVRKASEEERLEAERYRQRRACRSREEKKRGKSREWPKKLVHRSWTWNRSHYIEGWLERAFADAWEKENIPRPGINFGMGAAQDLFIAGGVGPFVSKKIIAILQNRDAMVAATIVQWLGTNCGMSFLRETLRSCGLDIKERTGDYTLKRFLVRFDMSKLEHKVLMTFQGHMLPREEIQAATGLSTRNFKLIFDNLIKLGFCKIEHRPAGEFLSLTEFGLAYAGGPYIDGAGKHHLTVTVNAQEKWLVDFPRSYTQVADRQVYVDTPLTRVDWLQVERIP